MTSKAILGIQKQNDSIFASLIAKNIYFERIIIPKNSDEQEYLRLLNEENSKLKEIVKANKPPPQPKPVVESKPKESKPKESKPKESKPKESKENKDDDEEDEYYDEPIKKFDTITNMEDIKRAFFRGDYELFEEQLKVHHFKLYKVLYNYNHEKNGVPDFVAKNLLKGFVQNFSDYTKYFMICFRCWQSKDKNIYKYDSLWVVNTNEPIQNIIGSIWEDFKFEETYEFEDFLSGIKKLPETEEPVYTDDGYTCIGESYVH